MKPLIICLSLVLMAGSPSPAAEKETAMRITSPAFEQNASMPGRYTQDGENISPPLAWTGPPAGTKSLVLVVHDPDAPDPAAPRTDWVHWILYNLPPTATGLSEGVAAKNLPQGTLEGTADNHRTGYHGPAPPVGSHRYFFDLAALDVVLPDLGRPTRARLEEAMKGHILARTDIMATYRRK